MTADWGKGYRDGSVDGFIFGVCIGIVLTLKVIFIVLLLR
jgi:hypothetical protein